MNLLKTGTLYEPASKGFSLHEPERSFMNLQVRDSPFTNPKIPFMNLLL